MLYEGQGSSENQHSNNNLVPSEKGSSSKEVEIILHKPVFKQLMKKGFYNYAQECIETVSYSQDTTLVDINELLSEIDPKIDEIKENIKNVDLSPEQ